MIQPIAFKIISLISKIPHLVANWISSNDKLVHVPIKIICPLLKKLK